MANEQKLGTIRPEFLVPEAKPFLLAFLDLMNDRMKLVMTHRRRGTMPGMTFLDALVSFHIFVFTIVGGDGSTQSDITEAIDAPRSTIRDVLQRLERAGLIVRTADGRYHTTEVVIHASNEHFDENMRQFIRLADTLRPYLKAIGR